MSDDKKTRAKDVHKRLSRAIPEPKCELDHENAWQLLVATILSAQSTDKMINKLTPALFARFPTPAALGAASQDEVETLVKQSGFFRNKAKSIREASRMVAELHGGEVPRTLQEMVKLPGVARKSANVVLGTAYGIPSGMTVDTHVGRVSRRLRFTKETDPVKVERDICALFPQDTWVDTSHRLVLHGRYICNAKKPKCAACPLVEVCPAAEAEPQGTWQQRADAEGVIVATRGESGKSVPTA